MRILLAFAGATLAVSLYGCDIAPPKGEHKPGTSTAATGSTAALGTTTAGTCTNINGAKCPCTCPGKPGTGTTGDNGTVTTGGDTVDASDDTSGDGTRGGGHHHKPGHHTMPGHYTPGHHYVPDSHYRPHRYASGGDDHHGYSGGDNDLHGGHGHSGDGRYGHYRPHTAGGTHGYEYWRKEWSEISVAEYDYHSGSTSSVYGEDDRAYHGGGDVDKYRDHDGHDGDDHVGHGDHEGHGGAHGDHDYSYHDRSGDQGYHDQGGDHGYSYNGGHDGDHGGRGGWVDGYGRRHGYVGDAVSYNAGSVGHRAEPWHGYDVDCPDDDHKRRH